MANVRRTFGRTNPDGTRQTVSISWDTENPQETLELDASGYKGNTCLKELQSVENIIGSGSIVAKEELYAGDDEQDVFIVGMS